MWKTGATTTTRRTVRMMSTYEISSEGSSTETMHVVVVVGVVDEDEIR